MRRSTLALVAALPLVAAGTAAAGEIQVGLTVPGGTTISSADLSGIAFFGNNGQDPSAPNFSTTSLGAIHDHILSNNSSGLSTEGWITIIAADVNTDDTPGADSLSIMTLIDFQDDDTNSIGGPVENRLDFAATVDNTTSAGWVNDVNEILTPSVQGGQLVTSGDFQWHSEDNLGDGFAFSGLAGGDLGSFSFSGLDFDFGGGGQELAGFQGVQVLSFEGGEWIQKTTFDFGEGDRLDLQFLVVPLPAPAVLGLAGLAGLAVARRRRG